MPRTPVVLITELIEDTIAFYDTRADRWIAEGQLKAAGFAIERSNKLRIAVGMRPRETITVH